SFPGRVFVDDGIPLAADYTTFLKSTFSNCSVVLSIIGRHWVRAREHHEKDGTDDWVRTELETALALPHVQVLPLLVNGAKMPTSGELPDSIRLLANRQKHDLPAIEFFKSIENLVPGITRLLAEAGERRKAQRLALSRSFIPKDEFRDASDLPL